MLFDGVDEYCPSLTAAAAEEYTTRGSSTKKTKMMKGKKRFSDEQIRLLESVFEKDSKLESRKKAQVARELGLQPRQVAIWFQNKRARFKSKQLERDYDSLAADYALLARRFEALEQEKQSLIKQLEKLNDLLNKGRLEGTQRWETTMGADIGRGSSTGSSHQSDDQNRSNNSSDSSNDNDKAATVDVNPFEPRAMRSALSLDGSDYGMGILSDDGCCSDSTNYFGMEEGTTTPLLMVANFRSTMETLDDDGDGDDDWDHFHADSLLLDDHSAHQWMDFVR